MDKDYSLTQKQKETPPGGSSQNETPLKVTQVSISEATLEAIRKDVRESSGVDTQGAPISVVVPLANNELVISAPDTEAKVPLTKVPKLQSQSLFSVAYSVGDGSRVTCCTIGGTSWCRIWPS